MENNNTLATKTTFPALHPVLWVAGIAVTLLSLTGIAALTGLLPTRSETPAPQTLATATSPATVSTPPAVTPPAATTEAAPVSSAPVQRHQPVKKQVAAETTRPMTAMPPPPLDSGVPPDYVPPPAVATAPPCVNCGVIADIRQITHEGQGSGLGAIAGGLLGGLVGNTVGNGNGNVLTTIAGAVGGGVLGNSIEKTQHETIGYRISVRMEDGTTRVVHSSTLPPWRIGDAVRLSNGSIVTR